MNLNLSHLHISTKTLVISVWKGNPLNASAFVVDLDSPRKSANETKTGKLSQPALHKKAAAGSD
jgi:hypothetical protein